jgi:hypothetical protein
MNPQRIERGRQGQGNCVQRLAFSLSGVCFNARGTKYEVPSDYESKEVGHFLGASRGGETAICAFKGLKNGGGTKVCVCMCMLHLPVRHRHQEKLGGGGKGSPRFGRARLVEEQGDGSARGERRWEKGGGAEGRGVCVCASPTGQRIVVHGGKGPNSEAQRHKGARQRGRKGEGRDSRGASEPQNLSFLPLFTYLSKYFGSDFLPTRQN